MAEASEFEFLHERPHPGPLTRTLSLSCPHEDILRERSDINSVSQNDFFLLERVSAYIHWKPRGVGDTAQKVFPTRFARPGHIEITTKHETASLSISELSAKQTTLCDTMCEQGQGQRFKVRNAGQILEALDVFLFLFCQVRNRTFN